ncbi:hypothetical protein EVAR_54696_1 [Eumeta japonica]|uniref:Uncharacterized protein n=1 Tax=Eumeta variegata TaxID=151549 RepID=A0A4C1X781_EUMVA|nr:hypothetical protein EVAR_54696_1 [Eumeta japonica]
MIAKYYDYIKRNSRDVRFSFVCGSAAAAAAALANWIRSPNQSIILFLVARLDSQCSLNVQYISTDLCRSELLRTSAVARGVADGGRRRTAFARRDKGIRLGRNIECNGFIKSRSKSAECREQIARAAVYLQTGPRPRPGVAPLL